MEDRDFMDMMYQGFTKTTRAEDAYWAIYDCEDGTKSVHAVDAGDVRSIVATNLSEEDAAFITAVHGSFPDIHRRWLEALDEADRFDLEKDMAEGVAAELSDRLAAAEKQVEDWHGKATQA